MKKEKDFLDETCWGMASRVWVQIQWFLARLIVSAVVCFIGVFAGWEGHITDQNVRVFLFGWGILTGTSIAVWWAVKTILKKELS